MTLSNALRREGNNLDFIRLILAMVVIVGHAGALNPESGYVDPIGNLLGFTYSGALAVKAFFFISGMLVTNSYLNSNSYMSFTISRMSRIAPGLIFVSICSAFIIGPLFTELGLDTYFSNAEVYRYVVDNASMYNIRYNLPGVFDGWPQNGVINGSIWTIRLEVVMYMLLLVVFYFCGNRLDFVRITTLLLVISPIFMSTPIIGTLAQSELYPLISCFFFGCFLSLYRDEIMVNIKLPLSFLIIYISVDHVIIKSISFYLMFSSGVFYLSTLNVLKKIKLKWDVSYGVYLWGWPIQQIVHNAFPSLSISLHIVVSFCFVIPLACISFCFVERPFIKLSKIYIRNKQCEKTSISEAGI